MTQTNIPDKRRQFIKSIVADACEHFNKPKLPLEIKALTRSYLNIRLISYSKHMKCMGLPYSYIIDIAKDSYTDYYADSNLYYIYYNDLDYNINSSNRYRWNIAHELGHVLLKHLSDNKKTRLLRSSLSDAEYDILEEEADYFAQLILVPHSPLLGFNIKNYNHIKILCKISHPAAKRRFYEFQQWKAHINANDSYDNCIFHYYFSYVFKRECKICGAGIIQRYGKYCPICGNKNTLQWGDGDKMKYPLIETHQNGKVKECPICKNEETNIEGDFCQICGSYIINRCQNEDCPNAEVLPSNARFCPICGYSSTFFNSGFLKPWDYNKSEGFMNIPEGIDDDLPFSSSNNYSNIPDGMDDELPFN